MSSNKIELRFKAEPHHVLILEDGVEVGGGQIIEAKSQAEADRWLAADDRLNVVQRKEK